MILNWILALALLSGISSGLHENSAREQSCFDLTNRTVGLDLNWVGTITTLYYPLMSRLELYRIAADLQQKDMIEIPESSIYYESCMHWNMYTNGTIISRGFNGLSREYKTNVLSPNMEMFELSPVEGMGYSGTVFTTMTDNKTFLFTPFCTNDGEMAWGLGSITPTLPEETLERVVEHALSLGFKREQFTELRYDMCPDMVNPEVDSVTENDEPAATTESGEPVIETTTQVSSNGDNIGFENRRYADGRFAKGGFAKGGFGRGGMVNSGNGNPGRFQNRRYGDGGNSILGL